MNIIARFINRLRFRKQVKQNECLNVVNGIAKAKGLYKELCILAHPDKHPGKEAEAEEIIKRITANKHNHSALIELKKEVYEKLF